MHSHDRTLIASLGFADPDKRSGLHDIACQYLAEPEQAQKLAELVKRKDARAQYYVPSSAGQECSEEEWQSAVAADRPRESWSASADAGRIAVKAVTEVPIVKGSGPYKSVVGFLDVMVAFKGVRSYRVERWVRSSTNAVPCGYVAEDISSRWDGVCCVEVKTTECQVSSIIRQIKLYKEFFPGAFSDVIAGWAVATTFKPTAGFVSELRREGIIPLTLGERFTQWIEARQAYDLPASDVGEM